MKYLRFLYSIYIALLNKKLRLTFHHCPNCERKKIFLITGLENYQIRCFSCHGTVISLGLISYLKKNKKLISLNYVYELSFHGVLFDFLKSRASNFYFSEFFSKNKKDRYVNGVRNEDIQKLTFKDNQFSLITSTEVFEHVPNYKQGFKEVYRVLKKHGHFIFTVPLFDHKKTLQIASVNNKKIKWHFQKEYHGSRVTGPNSVPVFWHHSKLQITSDLLRSGFNDAFLEEIILCGGRKQIVVIAQK
jgi:SAM-dependent methyltransferase